MRPRQSCIDCGFLGWCEVTESNEGLVEGKANSEVTKQERDRAVTSSDNLQYSDYGMKDQPGGVLGCYRTQWQPSYSYNDKKRKEFQNEVIKKRSCKHFIDYEPSRQPEYHLSLQEKARDRKDRVKDILYGAFAVAIATGLIEFVRWLFTKSN